MKHFVKKRSLYTDSTPAYHQILAAMPCHGHECPCHYLIHESVKQVKEKATLGQTDSHSWSVSWDLRHVN